MLLTQRIKNLCHQKGITFAELEREIEISNGQIRRWDKVSPKAETLQKVANYFHVTMDYLLGGDGSDIFEDETFRVLRRATDRMTPEQRETGKKLWEAVFSELFDD